MTFAALAKPTIATQPVYEPGKPIETVAREIGLDPAQIIKLASNENPLGPSPKAIQAVREALPQAHLYPDGGCYFLTRDLARRHHLEAENFIVGNGSNEIIELLGHVFLNPGDEVVMGTPAFIVYKLVTLLFGAVPVEVPLTDFTHDLEAMREAITERTKMVFLPSPNNPTGTANRVEDIMAFARSLPPHVIFVLDEAYAEYQDETPDVAALLAEDRLVFGLRTFSKIFGLASFRIGYGYGSADGIALLQRARQPFNVNTLAQVAARAALQDQEFIDRCRQSNREGLRQMEEGCSRLGLPWVPSEGNFLMVETGSGKEHFLALQARGVVVRPLTPYGLPGHLRLSIGTVAENERCLQALREILA